MQLNIRLANTGDIKKVFDLSNDGIVRNNSINSKKISWDEHVKWFNKRIKDEKYPFYIIETEKNDFVGQVRFDNYFTVIVISISLVRKYRGKGLASEIILRSVQKSGFTDVTAYIYENNLSSRNAFSKAGFKNTHLLKYTFKLED